MATPHKQISPATATAAIGGILVIIATVALVSANWSSFGEMAKMVIIGIPVLLMYALGFVYQKHEPFEEVSLVSIVTASIAFPFALGTILYQLVGATSVDSSLIAIVAGISTIWFICLEFLFGIRQMTILSFAAALTWIVSLTQVFTAPEYVAGLGYMGLGLLGILASTTIVDGSNSKTFSQFKSYLVFGIAVLIWGALSFIFGVHTYLSGGSSYYYADQYPYSEATSFYTILAAIASGLVFLGVASFLSKQFHAKKTALFASARQFMEGAGVITAIAVPVLLSLDVDGLTSQNYAIAATFVGLLTSALMMWLSYFAPIKGLRGLSIAGIVWFALASLARIFEIDNLSVPFVILGVGILMVIVAFVLSSKERQKKLSEVLNSGTPTYLFGLGEPMPKVEHGPGSTVHEVTRADGSVVRFQTSPEGTTPAVKIVAGVVLILFVMLLINVFIEINQFTHTPW